VSTASWTTPTHHGLVTHLDRELDRLTAVVTRDLEAVEDLEAAEGADRLGVRHQREALSSSSSS